MATTERSVASPAEPEPRGCAMAGLPLAVLLGVLGWAAIGGAVLLVRMMLCEGWAGW